MSGTVITCCMYLVLSVFQKFSAGNSACRGFLGKKFPMNPNLVIDISSDEEDVFGESGGRVFGDWISSGIVVKRVAEDSDDVVVIGEISPKRKRSRFCGSVKSSDTDLDDDCVVLDGDPDKPRPVLNHLLSGPDDLLVLGEKGQIACRDYPHARSLCFKLPFSATPHHRHCNLCHCYVCDSPAPCLNWGKGLSNMDHCHATEKEPIWKHLRRDFKRLGKRLPKVVPHFFTPQSNLIPDAETEILGQTGTVIGVESTSIDSAVPTQGHSGGNLNHLSVSSFPTCKRPEFNERVSLSQYISRNSLAATRVHNSAYWRKQIPVSTLCSWNPVNRQVNCPNMDSELGTYHCATFTNVVHTMRDEGLHQAPADGQPSLQLHSSDNSYMHRNQIQTVVDSSFSEFSLNWQNQASSPVGQISLDDPPVQTAVPTSEPSTSADYNHKFPSLLKPSECPAVMENGNESLSLRKPSVPSTGAGNDYGFPSVVRHANLSSMFEPDDQFPVDYWIVDDLPACGDLTYTMSSEANVLSSEAIDPGIPLFGYESTLEWPK